MYKPIASLLIFLRTGNFPLGEPDRSMIIKSGFGHAERGLNSQIPHPLSKGGARSVLTLFRRGELEDQMAIAGQQYAGSVEQNGYDNYQVLQKESQALASDP
jgi:hypothetical protein